MSSAAPVAKSDAAPAPAGLVLKVDNLRTHFFTPGGEVRAVRGVSLGVNRGESVGVVGESGSGKSVTALSIMRLIPTPPGRILSGTVELDGQDILTMCPRDLRRIRGGQIAMIFQDPFSSLNPTMKLGDQVTEAILAHSTISKADARQRALDLFRAVRLPSPELRMKQYPHQVSGGQRQRVMIAIGFAANPAVLIADEPTTALDVTVQAQIMSLMAELREKSGTAILLITHDLGLVAENCDRVLVMYAGQIVEEAPVEDLFREPKHPYTVGLLKSLPNIAAAHSERLESIPGRPPDLANLGAGCPFAPRCAHRMDVCDSKEPGEVAVGEGRSVRCHLWGDA